MTVINRREKKKRKRSNCSEEDRNMRKSPGGKSEKLSDSSNIVSREEVVEEGKGTGRPVVTNRRESKKMKRGRSSSSEKVTVVSFNGRGPSDESERHSGSNLNLKTRNIIGCSTESNNNQLKLTEGLLPDLEGEKVVARVKERLARMDERAKSEVGKEDEALKIKIELVKEKLKRYDFLIKVKRETEKVRHETHTVSFEGETNSDNIGSSGSDEDETAAIIILTPHRMRKLVRGWSWRDAKAAVEKKTGASVQRMTGTAPQQIRLKGSSDAILRAKKRIEDYIRDA